MNAQANLGNRDVAREGMTSFTFVEPTKGEDDEVEVEDADESTKPTVLEAEDIDPADWLSGTDVNEMYDYFYLRDGRRLKLAALTDSEEQAIRLASTKVNKANPRGPRQLDMTKYRRNCIAASLNKGKGLAWNAVGPGAVTGEALSTRPVGELTTMLEKVMEVSGMPTQNRSGNSASDAIDFFG